MRVARSIAGLLALLGGWVVAACAPPTPKAEPFAPYTVEREGVAPARDQDRSFQQRVQGLWRQRLSLR